MNEAISQVALNLKALRDASNMPAGEIVVQLKFLINVYREQLVAQNTLVTNALPTDENYVTLLTDMTDTMECLKVTLRAQTDLDKLITDAKKVLERVYKKLAI